MTKEITIPIEEYEKLLKDSKRYEHLRGKIGYNDLGVYLPCGITNALRRVEMGFEMDRNIDKELNND